MNDTSIWWMSHERLEAEVVTVPVGETPTEVLMAVLDQSPDCIKVLKPDGCLAYMNPNGRLGMEIDAFGEVEGQPWWRLWPAESQELVKRACDDARDGKVTRFTAFCPTGKGTPKWWDVGVSPILDRDGGVSSLLSISRDITQSKRDSDALEVMALEMRHRLRNAFTVSASMATALAPRSEPEVRAFANDLAARFGTLAIAQGRMLDSDASLSMRDLVLEVAQAFSPVTGTIEVGDLPVTLAGADAVRTVALVLGELGTNSIKHGALGNGGRVELWGEDRGSDGFVLRWRETVDNGIDRTAASGAGSGDGVGMKLMQRMARAHGGAITTEMRATGIDVSLALPRGRALEAGTPDEGASHGRERAAQVATSAEGCSDGQ